VIFEPSCSSNTVNPTRVAHAHLLEPWRLCALITIEILINTLDVIDFLFDTAAANRIARMSRFETPNGIIN